VTLLLVSTKLALSLSPGGVETCDLAELRLDAGDLATGVTGLLVCKTCETSSIIISVCGVACLLSIVDAVLVDGPD
jgi:hypothetical protein